MKGTLVKQPNMGDEQENLLRLAGLVTEVKDRRSIEAFRPNQISINRPDITPKSRRSIVFHSARSHLR